MSEFPPPVIATLNPASRSGWPTAPAARVSRTISPATGPTASTRSALTRWRWPPATASRGRTWWSSSGTRCTPTDQRGDAGFIRARRDIEAPPGEELKDYEEYAHLYYLAWSDPANRWLLSTLSSAMIFDDHDIRDDWKLRGAGGRDGGHFLVAWADRRWAGSYWVYQHLGNLSPQERAEDAIWQRIAGHLGEDEIDLSAELDSSRTGGPGPTSYRWSFCRDFGDTRLIVVDSRAPGSWCRTTAPCSTRRKWPGWTAGCVAVSATCSWHVTAIPAADGPDYVEAWNEAVSDGAWGRRAARAARSCGRPSTSNTGGPSSRASGGWREWRPMSRRVTGADAETVLCLSGDVHHSYVSDAERPPGSRIVQAVCSPIRNPLPRSMRSVAAHVLWPGNAGGSLGRTFCARSGPSVELVGKQGPVVHNYLATLDVDAGRTEALVQTGVVDDGDQQHPRLERVASLTLAPRSAAPARRL